MRLDAFSTRALWRTVICAGIVLATACGGDSTSPPKPSSVVLTTSGALEATVGQVVSPSPSIQILDAKGNPIVGLAFTVTVVGGGTLSGTPARTTSGSTPLGTWTLGPNPGAQSLQVVVTGLTPFTIQATAIPVVTAIPASIVFAAGDGQTGTPNSVLPASPAFRVLDAAGAPIAGLQVQFSVTHGGGTIAVASAFTDAQGQASPGTWRLGATAGAQTLSVTAGSVSFAAFATAMAPAGGTFAIDIRYVGTLPSQAIQDAFTAAKTRMQSVIVASLTSFVTGTLNAATSCAEPTLPTINETIQNMIIYVEITDIDGVGKILGQSGPCVVRGSTSLPILGLMKFDIADINTLVAAGSVNSVILHEMQHVLGFGTLWSSPFPVSLLQGASTSNPVYLGAASRGAYVAAGGTSSLGVPVENSGGVGTVNSHWRETVFQTELMTGFLTGASQPFSRISMGALADLGYSVSYATADTYAVPAPGQLRAGFMIIGLTEYEESVIRPRFSIDEHGRMTPIPPG